MCVSSWVLTRWPAVVALPGVGGAREEAGRPCSDAKAARSRLRGHLLCAPPRPLKGERAPGSARVWARRRVWAFGGRGRRVGGAGERRGRRRRLRCGRCLRLRLGLVLAPTAKRACAPPSGRCAPPSAARATDRRGCRRPQPPLPPPRSLPPRSSPLWSSTAAPDAMRAPAAARARVRSRSACAWARCQSWRRWMVPRATAPRARAPRGCPRPPAAPVAALAPRAGVAGAAPLTAPPRPSPWRAPPPRAAPRRLHAPRRRLVQRAEAGRLLLVLRLGGRQRRSRARVAAGIWRHG